MYSFFRRIYSDPETPLDHKWRVGFVIVSFVSWLAAAIDVTIVLTTSTLCVERFIQKLFNFLFSFFVPFGIVRVVMEGGVPRNATLTFLVQCCNIATSGGSLQVSPTRSAYLQAVLLMMVIAGLNLPWWKTQCLTLIPGILISAYNATFGINGYPMALMVNPESGLDKELIVHSRLLWMIPLSLFMARTLIDAYNRSLRRLEGALWVAKRVSENLAEYDTKAAEAVLTEFSIHADCDKQLCEVLSTIVDDMKSYKPYLPNYIVAGDDDDDDDDEEDHETTTAKRSNATKVEMFKTQRNVKRPSLPTSTLQPPKSQKRDLEVVTATKEPHSPQLISMIPSQRTVSYAMLEFRIHTTDIIDNPLPLRSFVDHVHRYANASKGAVHCFLGDCVHMTWNATNVIPNPTQCAVRSLRMPSSPAQPWFHSVQHQQHASTWIELFGSVMTGSCECRITGAAHRIFLLRYGWRDAQRALHEYARLVKTNVVCETTASAIYDRTRLVDSIKVHCLNEERPSDGDFIATEASTVEVTVHELITPEEHELWGTVCEEAVQAYQICDFVESLTLIQEKVSSVASPPPRSVQYLKYKLQQAVLQKKRP